MGRDREFSDVERKWLLETVYRFRTHWEQFEYACLEKDRDALVAEKDEDETLYTEEATTELQEKENEQVMKALYPALFPDEEGSVENLTAKESKKDSKKEEGDEEEKEMTIEDKQNIGTDVRLKQ